MSHRSNELFCDELRKEIKRFDRWSMNVIEMQVWSAAYVQILSSSQFPKTFQDEIDMLATPTKERQLMAIAGANNAVVSLRLRLEVIDE